VTGVARVATVVFLLSGAACSSRGAEGGATTPANEANTRPDFGPPRVGDAAPDFELPDRSGKPVSLASFRGSDVVVHFTAAWCPYCDAEIDAIGRMAEGYASSGVKVMLVDIQDKDPGWESLEAHVPKSVILVRDAAGDVSRRYAPPKALPAFTNRAEVMLAATVVVDKLGKIAAFEIVSTNPAGGFDPNLTPIRQNLDHRLASSGAPHVLDVTADQSEIAVGSGSELTVHVHIGPDFHIMSNAPSKPSYVATVVELSGPLGVTFGKPRYPAPATYRLSDTEISTFRGNVDVAVPFTTDASVPAGTLEIHGTLHYQACTESRCLFPRDETFRTTLNVLAKP
jgi:peroxiredoxin